MVPEQVAGYSLRRRMARRFALEARGGGKEMKAKKLRDTKCELIELLMSINETAPGGGLSNKEEMLSGRSWESALTTVS